MARLGAKVSWSEVSSIPEKPFSVRIFWRKRPQTYFRCQTGYMVRSGSKLLWPKTLLNFASKAPSNSFFQKTRFRFEFLYKIAPHLFSWPNGLDGMMGAKVSWSEVSSILKTTFSVAIFWWNRPHTSFLGLICYMVRSGAKLSRKTLLNFTSKALQNLFFRKTRFRFEFLY